MRVYYLELGNRAFGGWGAMQTKRPVGTQWLQEWRQEVECELCPKLTQIALNCTLQMPAYLRVRATRVA